MRCFCVIVVHIILFSICSSELSVEKTDKFLNGFIDYLNNLPNQKYAYEEGVLLSAQQTDENCYKIGVKLKVTEIHNVDSIKFLKCFGSVLDLEESGITIQNNAYSCQELGNSDGGSGQFSGELEEVVLDRLSTEPVFVHRPVQLDNEVQNNDAVSSGEQFVAVPRRQPVPCVGCASHVDPQARGVSDLAQLGVQHLNMHEPDVRHTLNTVLDVERQVQIVNGVRFILTLTVDYDNCTLSETETCKFQIPCKISILEKPWIKLSDGSKYRAIVANNCTEEWLFGDNGEIITQNPNDNKENNEILITPFNNNNDKVDDSQKPTPDYDKIAYTGSVDDILKIVNVTDVQAQPNQEKTLTYEEIKALEEQIIPNEQFYHPSTNNEEIVKEVSQGIDVNSKQVDKLETVKPATVDLAHIKKPYKDSPGFLIEDRKKAIDDLMNLFNYVGFHTKSAIVAEEHSRTRRSYESDLRVMSLSQKFQKLKNNIINAKNLFSLGQTMVDYLNEMDMEVKTRTIKDVTAAEEEFENHQHFVYLQARVIIPCDKADCASKDTDIKICNGIMDNSDPDRPQVLNAFCYDEETPKPFLGKVVGVPFDDPILIKLTHEAIKKIESEQPYPYSMRVKKIINANTQKVSGTVTKISVILEYTNCNKTVPFVLRIQKNCPTLGHLGTQICEVEIHSRYWLKQQKIMYTCTARPVDESFSKTEYGGIDGSVSDPKVLEIAHEALQYLEVQSNRNNKQKVVEVKSVSTQLVAGLLTKVDFIVGYTECTNDFEVDINTCKLLETEPLRKCQAEVWERPWLEEGRQVKVTCDSAATNVESNDTPKLRKKRSSNMNFVGGELKQDTSHSSYISLAEESLEKYLNTSKITQQYEVVKIKKVTTQQQNNSGTLTIMDFKISPKTCQLSGNSLNCEAPVSADFMNCRAKVWERPWPNSKEITVNCIDNKQKLTSKRQIPGGLKEQDPNDLKYKQLADESLQKYLETSGVTEPHKVLNILKVTKQVVSGSLTKIHFEASPTNCQDNNNDQPDKNCSANVLTCNSQIWERVWLKSIDTAVNCEPKDSKPRKKRQIPGGETDQDPSQPRFKNLAEESLQKYLQISESTQHHKVVQVVHVKTQVVSGQLIKIDFIVSPTNCSVDSDGQPTSSNCEVKNETDVFNCHSEVWDQSWLNKTEITVNCTVSGQKSREKRRIAGGPKEQDANDPKYKQLAGESLQKYLETSGVTEPHIVLNVLQVTKQVVSGSLTKIHFEASPTNCQDNNNDQPDKNCSANVLTCSSEIWERVWLKSIETTVNCEPKDSKPRKKRQIPGGETDRDPSEPRFKNFADESLRKYLQISESTQHHKVVQVVHVKTQVVSGQLIKIDFIVSPTNCSVDSNGQPMSSNCEVKNEADISNCHSEVWEQSWLNKTEITVNCTIINLSTKTKRSAELNYIRDVQSPFENITRKRNSIRRNQGGKQVEDASKPEFRVMAEESLRRYKRLQKSKDPHNVLEIKHVVSQVVSGISYTIDYTATKRTCSDKGSEARMCKNNTEVMLYCRSNIWNRPWLKRKDIDVSCNSDVTDEEDDDNNIDKDRDKRSLGSEVNENVHDREYKLLVEEALQKYYLLSNAVYVHKVIKIDRVTKQVVSGQLIKINYSISPTLCLLNESQTNSDTCEVQEPNIVLRCRAEILDQPWISSRKNIKVSCGKPRNIKGVDGATKRNTYEEESTHKNIVKRSLSAPTTMDINSKKYILLADEALSKYQNIINAEYIHKVVKIYNVSEQVVEGLRTRIDLSIAPTKCLISATRNSDNCEILKSKMRICQAEIWESVPSVPRNFEKDIKIICKKREILKRTDVPSKPDVVVTVREKRQVAIDDDDYIEEDSKEYYASRAVSHYNQNLNFENLFKLISIHGIQRSSHMKTPMVRMYLELAMTYCLRRKDESELHNCDELDGMNHKLCLARLWPSPDDELVVRQVSVVCEDDDDWDTVTGLSVVELIKASLLELEKNPEVKYKLVHQGEPHWSPSLDSSKPNVLNFIISFTNCTKDIDVDLFRSECFIDMQRPSKSCRSLIWMEPNSRKIRFIKAECTKTPSTRNKRAISFDPANATTDELTIQKLVQESLEKLEMSSVHRYKQRVLLINSYSSKIVTGKVTTIDFDVGYTTCLKYEWVENITSCEFLEHLPRRHCVAQVWERLWLDNGKNIDVNCEDDETPLEAHIEFESAENAMQLAKEALKHIEAKYPHPRKQKVVRIFSLEKQAVAGVHYRMKMEVGFTDCMALSIKDNCKLVNDMGLNKFCRVNVWLRPWTDNPPNYRVSCDYQDGATTETYYQVQAEHLFHDFLTTYKPVYLNDPTEMLKRFDIFKQNVRNIHELNIYERGTARYAVTKFSDLTHDEFSKKYLGLRPSLRDENQVPMRKADIPAVQLPDKFDWRDYDAVTEVKDQGSCGSCWAFSVTGNIEGQWKMQSGQLVSLSEQELVDCDKLDEGCNGGLPDNAYRAIEQLGGLETEADYPYEGEDDKCAYNKSLSRVEISGAVNISSNETNMAKWLVQNGPISIGINANAMQFYVGGVSHPWRVLCDPSNLDHGVLIVGYGVKDYPLFHKRLPFWIVKNSWGKSWGEQGYYRVYRGDGTCGLNMMASSAVI